MENTFGFKPCKNPMFFGSSSRIIMVEEICVKPQTPLVGFDPDLTMIESLKV
jgi:hypothetical protein